VFGDSAVFRNTSNNYIRLSHTAGNTFHSHVLIDQNEPTSGVIHFAHTGTTKVGGNVIVQSNKVGNYSLTNGQTGTGTVLEFFGPNNQMLINQLNTAADRITFNRIHVNKSFANGLIQFDKPVNLVTAATFTKGKIDLQSQEFRIESGISTIGNDSSYIRPIGAGLVRNVAVGNSEITVALGNTSTFLPIKVYHGGGSQDVLMRMHDGVHDEYTAGYDINGTLQTTNFVNGTWVIQDAGNNLRAKFGWKQAGEMSGFDRNNMSVLNYRTTNPNAFNWDCFRLAALTGAPPAPYFTDETQVNGVRGPFTLYSTNVSAGNTIGICNTPSVNLAAVPFSFGMVGQWSVDSKPLGVGTINFSNPNDPNATATGLTHAGTYVFRWRNISTGVVGNCQSNTVAIISANSSNPADLGKWTGIFDGDWHNCVNWKSGIVPDSLTNVTYEATTPNQPVIDTTPLGNIAKCNSITISSGKTLTQVNGGFWVYGNFTNNGTFTQTADSAITFKDDTVTLWSGNGTQNIRRIRLLKDAVFSQVQLQRAVTATHNVDFVRGRLATTNTNLLTLTTTATATNASDSSFASGPVAKDMNTLTKFYFPIGKGTYYRPVALTPSSTIPTTFRAEYFGTQLYAPASVRTDQNAENLDHASAIEYWDVTRTAGTANAKIALTWNHESLVSSNPAHWSALRVAHWDGSAWENVSLATTTIDPSSTYSWGEVVSNIDITNFSPFTLGTLIPFNPLPLKLLNFTAKKVEDKSHLQWVVTNNQDAVEFRVERTTQLGKKPELLATIAADAFVNDATYEFWDDKPWKAANWYRIAMVEKDGSVKYSNWRVINHHKAQEKVAVYPNPFTSEVFVAVTDAKTISQITIFTADGKLVEVETMPLGQDMYRISTEKLAQGVYFLRIITNDGASEVTKLLKQ
jgi:hypothetical protein